MLALSTSELLNLWEHGAGMHALDRGLLAIAALLPHDSSSAQDWPLGRRNRALLDAYASVFGEKLQGWAACDRCGEKMEFEINAHALASAAAETGAGHVAWKGTTLRLPTSRDLAEAAREATADAAVSKLISLCCESGTVGDLHPEELEALGDALAAADPLAEIRLSLECPACGETVDETVDISQFFWAQLEAASRRAFWEIHTLASAYTWSEREILSLSAPRRAEYLRMVLG